jgi:hypothetical protein
MAISHKDKKLIIGYLRQNEFRDSDKAHGEILSRIKASPEILRFYINVTIKLIKISKNYDRLYKVISLGFDPFQSYSEIGGSAYFFKKVGPYARRKFKELEKKLGAPNDLNYRSLKKMLFR